MATRKTTTSKRSSKAAVGGRRTRKAAAPNSSGLAASDLALPSSKELEREARKREVQWRTESDLRTLREAEQIRADPGRLRNVTRMARAEAKALQKIQNQVSR